MAGFVARHPYETCPLCGSNDFSPFRRGNCVRHQLYRSILPPFMTWCRCAACGHVFTDGYFTDEARAVLFGRTHSTQQVGHDIEGQRHISSRIVERVAGFAPSEGAWLDVGFGNGSLLFTAEEWGYTPVGVDLREASVAALANLEIESHCIDLARLDHGGRYSVVSMADVLEHMPFPKDGLAAAHRLLGKGGVLFLSMPNSDSRPWKLLSARNANPYWAEIEHYHNFGRARLYRLLEECGFKPENFAISQRYRLCMEVISKRLD
jgi:protein O-GlcNAc transferase